MEEPAPPTLPHRRYHDLDALRASAMLLGIVLHSLLSFIDFPIWPAQDLYRNNELYGFIQQAIHGFRMPLFFLISGFFTAMLWRKRGLGGLLKQRAIRILIPMGVGVVLVWPMMIGIGIWGGISKEKINKQRSGMAAEQAETIWTAAKTGDLEGIARTLDAGAGINRRDGMGISPLGWAALQQQVDAVERLIERGADVNAPNDDGSSPLHQAAFVGNYGAAALLLEHGAEVNARNKKNETPLDSLQHSWEVVQWIAGMLDLELDREEFLEGRKKTAALLKDHGGKIGKEAAGKEGAGDILIGIYMAGAFAPVFHHLWFLNYLWLLVILFMVLASIWTATGWTFPENLVTSPLRWLWLLPLSLLAQYYMRQGFGVDTATGLLPWPPTLLYYAVFFCFGALCHGRPRFDERAGAGWPLWFLLSIPALLGGLHFLEVRGENFARNQALCSLCAVLYTWLMVYGWIGFFRRFCSAENRVIRYLSDSAYWLYLAHLPLVMILQILVSGWHLPSGVKFLIVCTGATVILLWSYDIMVRYTFIGAVLNGRKYRGRKAPPA